jgi:fused signal recognition particle receptor
VSTQTLWIVIAVAVVVLIAAAGLGVWLRSRRRISLRDSDTPSVGTGTGTGTAPRRGGTYTASGGFDFAPGGVSETEPEVVEPQAPTGSTAKDPAELDAGPPGVDGVLVDPTPTDTADLDPAVLDPAVLDPAVLDPAVLDEVPADTVPQAAPEHTPTDGSPFPSGSAPPGYVEPPVGALPAGRAPEEIDPAEGRLVRLRGRLARSRSGFGQGLLGLLGAGELDEESWEDVEAMLLQADLGPDMTHELVDTLRTELARRAVRTPEQARTLLREVLTDALRTDLDRSVRALPHDGRPAVLLIVGVNGTGKTTTTGKLARVLVGGGRHVVLGAADTFRAAAAEQLGTWGERAGATVVRGAEGADPASVAFDAVKQGAEEGADAVLLDTAGRLHTKTGLMDELGKVKRVVERQAEIDEVLLVLDATTGQNGLTQARVFGDVVKVTGIALTKLDGTAKGGIVFRVQRELGVPVKLVGLGEGPDDLAPFEPAAFVDALLGPVTRT